MSRVSVAHSGNGNGGSDTVAGNTRKKARQDARKRLKETGGVKPKAKKGGAYAPKKDRRDGSGTGGAGGSNAQAGPSRLAY